MGALTYYPDGRVGTMASTVPRRGTEEEILRFHHEHGKEIVLKPLRGYGGKDVYLLKGDTTNLSRIVESIGRSSYVIAQEFLPAAKKGDTRLLLINGRPLRCEGKYAAVLD